VSPHLRISPSLALTSTIFIPQANLHRPTVYELIFSHGRTDVFLHYATITGDFQRVVEHYVMNEEWGKAVDQLSRQVLSIQRSNNSLPNNLMLVC
jgi:hypothetical protein